MKNKQAILLVVSLVIFGWLLVTLLRRGEDGKDGLKGRGGNIVATPTVFVPPTKTEEEKEIIREIKTHEVKITDGGFEPASLVVKLHDQVEWVNETEVSHKIKADNWGGLEIRPGKRFTQSFEKTGIYPYSCEFHSAETGEVMVE